MNAKGALYARWKSDTKEAKFSDGIKTAAKIGADNWRLEAMIPFKMLAGDEAAVFTTGLSLPLVEPMFMGEKEQMQVDELPLRTALYMAVDAARNRENYDEPLANPLKKLYHEKRDESEKVRFTIPKKHEEKN